MAGITSRHSLNIDLQFCFMRAVFALSLLWLMTSAQAVGPVVVPPNETVAGVSQTEWSVRWWQWAFSFERPRSPVADTTGALCASRQSGEVWFLAGTYGTRRTERSCTVPAGKVLFFPLINYVTFRAENSDESCDSLARRAARLTDNPSALILEVDGVRYDSLAAHRLPTKCFSLVSGQPADAVADGYFVAVGPLARGQHVINFGGALPSMLQAVTYTLTVE
ncbi:hypothetical protein AACH06_24660 [Ideonella sp. DXS29W]|uniref:Uncharacterized protein n=1 Tax=Ideonella lacteola TaxID=2984193 RepID=A0ABU9BVN5_9BURK